MEYYILRQSDYLEHHGIKGQRWGVRRFQYENGSYTPAGEKRYDDVRDNNKKTKAAKKETRDPKKALKTAAIIGASAATAALAIYGGKKVNDLIKNKATEIKIKDTIADLRAQEMAIREWEPLSASDSALLWATRVETENNAINRLRNNSSKQKITEAAKLVYNDYKYNRR